MFVHEQTCTCMYLSKFLFACVFVNSFQSLHHSGVQTFDSVNISFVERMRYKKNYHIILFFIVYKYYDSSFYKTRKR